VPFGPQIVVIAFGSCFLLAPMLGGADSLIVVGTISLLAMGVFVLWAGGFWEPFGLPSAF
jgi:hypothetical protein